MVTAVGTQSIVDDDRQGRRDEREVATGASTSQHSPFNDEKTTPVQSPRLMNRKTTTLSQPTLDSPLPSCPKYLFALPTSATRNARPGECGWNSAQVWTDNHATRGGIEGPKCVSVSVRAGK
jgi:hypothetical protein